MTQAQTETRQDRPVNGALVAQKTDEGFRVYSPHDPTTIYLVKHDGERWTCQCPDFEAHKADTTWRCAHILAVAPWPKRENGNGHHPPVQGPTNGSTPAPTPQGPTTQKRKARPATDIIPVQMLIKRSVSPDGRIDSVSVEFSMPVHDITNGEIKDKALKTLQLQKEIVTTFLNLNGQKPSAVPPSNPPNSPSNNGNGNGAPTNGTPVFAHMIDIGKVQSKWGERLCINFQIKDRRYRLFGSPKQLAAHIGMAGYQIDPQTLEYGLRLNLACRVTTKPSDDGKYVNVDQVLPPPPIGTQGGSHDNAHN